MTKIIRYSGSPDSDVSDWKRINHLTHQPGPGSAYCITIEPISPVEEEPPTFQWFNVWMAGITISQWGREAMQESCLRIQNGTAAIGETREEALANLRKAKQRGPL